MITAVTFGPSPILATAVVPWTDAGKLDEPRFSAQIAQLANTLSHHLYIFGTAGEGYAVSDTQFKQVADCFIRTAEVHRVRPMIGVISLSLVTMVERIEFGRQLGVREFQVSLPSWGPLSDAELDRFFGEVCDRFPDCQFLHYNVARSKRLLAARDYMRLIERHPNLVAVKTGASDPEVIAQLIKVPRLRFYFTEFGYAVARKLKADCGLLISLATINPNLAHDYVQGSDQRRAELLPDLQAISAALLEIAGDQFHMDGGFDKLLWSVHDPGFPLHLLPPYLGPKSKDAATFRQALPLRWRPAP